MLVQNSRLRCASEICNDIVDTNEKIDTLKAIGTNSGSLYDTLMNKVTVLETEQQHTMRFYTSFQLESNSTVTDNNNKNG